MLQELLTRSPWPLTADEVAAVLEVDVDTARRALELLKTSGSAVEVDGRYSAFKGPRPQALNKPDFRNRMVSAWTSGSSTIVV